MTLSPAALTLVPGSVAASVGLFSSFTLQFIAPVPLTLDKLGPSAFNAATRLRIFALSYKRAAPIMMATGFFSAALALFPTFYHPNPASKVYLRTAAFAFLSLTPYTLLTLANTSKQLLALDRSIDRGSGGTLILPEADGKRAVKLLKNWAVWANLRVAVFAVGWGGMVLGLGKELRVI